MQNKTPIRTITIVVASPADVTRKRELMLNHVPTRFTKDKYEDLCGARIIVMGWEDLPSQAGYPQDTINQSLIENCDILIALFKHTLGTPTIDPITSKKRAKSGTAEELLYAIGQNESKKKPLAMAFYYENPPDLIKDENESKKEKKKRKKRKKEWLRLGEFKDELKQKITYKLYDDEEEKFIAMICKDICHHIMQNPLLNEE